MTDELTVDVAGRPVRVSSLDRVLYPDIGFTKAELIDYYTSVAEALLPYLRDRPSTLHRYPEGIDGKHFFQTRCPPHPPWVRTATMHFPRTGKTFAAPVLDDVASLVWAANLATIELHPFLGRVDDLDTPTQVVFDLDPGAPAGIAEAARVALRLREMLAEVGLRGWPKTSGAKGLHVHVPLHAPTSYPRTKRFARTLAELLERDQPDRVVHRMSRDLRAGRVLVDWSQNDPGKSTVAPYSLRGLPVPTVAAPLTWDEVEALGSGGRYPLIGPAQALARLDRYGDLMAPASTRRQRLPD